MAAKVFISYRRADSAGYSGRVMDRLDRELGRDLVFMDVDAIPLARTSRKSCTRRSPNAACCLR
jgi:hypothetical protein